MGEGPRRPGTEDEGNETWRAGAPLENSRIRSYVRQAWVLDDAVHLQPERILLAAHRDRVPQLSGSSAGPRRNLTPERPLGAILIVRPSAFLTGSHSWMPAVDVFHRGKDLVVRADLPGINPEGYVDITLQTMFSGSVASAIRRSGRTVMARTCSSRPTASSSAASLSRRV